MADPNSNISSRSNPQKHGATVNGKRTPEYEAYKGAKRRCNQNNFKEYHRYGGRGIEFRFNNFADFLAEVGPRPTPNHSLDRIDNNGHYEKGNLRWATRNQQTRNSSRNVLLTLDGETHPIVEWKEILHIPQQRIENRLRYGWCDRCALTLPLWAACTHR